MLANLYMNRFLKYWRMTGRSEAFQARVVNYADDFVILSRGHAAEALEWTRTVMTRMGLTLNEAKTKIREAARHGLTFWDIRSARSAIGKMVTGIWARAPSKKSVLRVKHKVGDLLRPSNVGNGTRSAIASIGR
jgi:RNA-directed DNA polymerase